MLLKLSDIISSLGIAFKTLEVGGTLILFWTIINVMVPSVHKILTLLGFAFDSVRVITDDINQNFFQGVPEYYLECTGYKANLSTELINHLLDVGIRGIDYSYRICDILDYFDNYSQNNPNQCLFYKHYEEPFYSASRGSSASRITKKQTGKSRTKSLRLSQFLESVSSKSKLKSSLFHHKTRRTHKTKNRTSTSKSTSPPEIKYIEDFNLPPLEWDAIKSDAGTSYNVMILANRLEGIFIEFFERANSMIANDLEVDIRGNFTVRKQAITQRKVHDIRRFINMLETNHIAYNKHLLTILKEQEDELLERFYTLDNTINTRIIRYRDLQTRDLIKHGFQDIKLGAPFELDFMNTCFDKINLAYRVKENMKMVLGIGAGERVPKIVQEGYEDMTRSLPQYITARYGSTLPAIKISNAFTKLWEIMTVFGSLIPSAKSKGVGTDKLRVFHICEAPGQMIISLKYFLEKKRRNIVDYDWLANSLNPYNKENQDIYGKGTIFADDYSLIRGNPKKWIWGADGTGDITRIKNIRWYRDHITKTGVDMIVGDGGLSTQSGIGLDPLVLQKLDLAQVVMVLACSKKGGSCVIKHFTPYIKKHTSTYSAAGFFIGFLYLYYLAFAEVSLFKPYTSNPDSGEFYVIGQGFLGVDDESLERLYKILERIELNQSIISEDKIPETFVLQISGFLERITNLNVMSIEKQNLLLTCYKDGQNPKLKKYLKCDNFLDKDNLQNIQRPRFEEWIKKYGFV
jgi:hypothetical protein